jgi:hypothetical protein
VPSSSKTCKRARRRAAAGSHQRSSAGQGPDQPVIATDGPPAIGRTRREGAAVHCPRPVTPTGTPSGPRTSTRTGTGWTSAGEGGGMRPGQGGVWASAVSRADERTVPARMEDRPPALFGRDAFRDETLAALSPADPSPQGTRRICSPGPLPPERSATRTASWPKRPWTRARPRSTCRLASAMPPAKSNWRPPSGTASPTVSLSIVTPALGAVITGPCSHPSSCQRTLSTMARAVKGLSPRQQRCSDSPCSVSASTSS